MAATIFEEFLEEARLHLTYELYPPGQRSRPLARLADQASSERWNRLRIHHERRHAFKRLREERVRRQRCLATELRQLYRTNDSSPDFQREFNRRFRVCRVNTVRACIHREYEKWRMLAAAILGNGVSVRTPTVACYLTAGCFNDYLQENRPRGDNQSRQRNHHE